MDHFEFFSVLAILCCPNVFSLMLPPTTPPAVNKLKCEFYEYLNCNSQGSSSGCNTTVVTCGEESDEPAEDKQGKQWRCYALWDNRSGIVSLKKKGCWLNSFDCSTTSACVSSEATSETPLFCCCGTDMCNANLRWRPTIPVMVMTSPGTKVRPSLEDQWIILRTVLLSLVPLIVITLIITLLFWLWRRRKQEYLRQLPSSPVASPAVMDSLCPSLGPIQLLEVKAQGRFGCVWKSQMANGYIVAVKVFPQHDRQSWATERDFYSLIRMNEHVNVLHFIGAEYHDSEFWLITDYHERGSVYDYLKCDVISREQMMVIALSMCQGLSYLHDAIGMKPSIAHRDFKSRNVLLRSDFTACIADFGLALVLDGQPGDVHSQVGTRRYMSPEVLDGSINFTIEHFLKIDMYACALVLWELLSRCVTDEEVLGDYRMPFELEVGSHPSLEDMQDVVVNKKLRPQFKESWLQNEELAFLCSTIEECWDQDPEARLSAECVELRLSFMFQTHYESKVSVSTSHPHSDDKEEDSLIV